MSLTVEDGTGMADADSLVELGDVRAFATSRGVTLDASDDVVETQIRKAHDYLIFLESRLRGERASATQALPFPRKCMTVHGTLVDSTEVPIPVKQAVKLLVCQTQDVDPLPIRETKVVTQETVGPIQTSYRILGNAPSFPVVDALLEPYMRGTARMLEAVRV